MKNVTKTLPCQLTDEEKIRLGQENAREIEKRAEAEQAKKDSAADFKAQIERHDLTISRLSRIVASGQEWRPVECEVQFDYGRNTATTVRTDTGEVVEVRTLTKDEQQMQLDGVV